MSRKNQLGSRILPSTVNRNQNSELSIAGLAISDLVKEYGDPLYLIDEADFRSRCRAFVEEFQDWQVYYASKAFLTADIARWVIAEGLHLDVCSGGELTLAIKAGIDPKLIAFHGNNKTYEELELAVTAGVGKIIVDSFSELARLNAFGKKYQQQIPILLRLTVGVEAHTHEFIATAHEDQKFGFSIASGMAQEAVAKAIIYPYLDLQGVHSHIGSQIFDTQGFQVAAQRMLLFLSQIQKDFDLTLPHLDLGGGFGIAYTHQDQPLEIKELAQALRNIVRETCAELNYPLPQISIEPGRAIVGPAGIAVYRVGTIKDVQLADGIRRYVSVSGGMSDNIRPALYQAEYQAILVDRRPSLDSVRGRLVGSHCESGDILIREFQVPNNLEVGDLLVLPASGAYCRAMASNYNMRLKPAVVSVKSKKAQVLLRAETLADLFALDQGLQG